MQQMYADLLAAIARQAVHDLHTAYTHPRHMDAGAWLEAAGLLDQAQYRPPYRKQRRRSPMPDTTMNDAIRGTPQPTATPPEALTDVAAINAEIRRLAGRPVEEKHEEHAT